ncbi:hypothetical protein CsSME_00003492 [Camellia sinensis var. sinensis]
MESPYYAPPHLDAAASLSSSSSSRPSIGFPLGTALLLIIIFSLSGVFSCCYHWDKLRSLRQSSHAHPDPDVEAHHHPDASPSNPNSTHIVIFIFIIIIIFFFFFFFFLFFFFFVNLLLDR